MFLTFGSQHARQSLHSLFCFGAGQVAALVTTVDVLGQAPAGAWSIMGIENLTTKFLGGPRPQARTRLQALKEQATS